MLRWITGGVIVSVVSLPDERAEDLVLVHDRAQRFEGFALALGGGEFERASQANRRRTTASAKSSSDL